ncbi:hypothetical protein G3N58_31760 [Paraburkholderia sp. Ac-20342]|uniref:hypothetical protein n=1 Tax=Paraburkholderia sp. Ac-20342 TaxID=2703889 RepID=UPI00197E9FF0|nr:hypothetical protein [Paraburkholderia sp. Ac-20342]MBN3851360.1 hypothetical protein [Paraburkholderia sp. Ac-20342]
MSFIDPRRMFSPPRAIQTVAPAAFPYDQDAISINFDLFVVECSVGQHEFQAIVAVENGNEPPGV